MNVKFSKTIQAVLLFFFAAVCFCVAHEATSECCVSSPLSVQGTLVSDCPVVCVTPPTYKVVCETVFDEQKVVSYKPIWETEIRTRPYTVSKQVAETEMREERYTVRIPVTEVVVQDHSYERVRYVPETCEREVVSYCDRPVQKVVEQERVMTVCKPVHETRMESRSKTVLETMTSYETKYVDQGAYTDQLVLKPNRGLLGSRLAFHEPKAVTDECTGEVYRQRGGLYWTPSHKGRYEVEKIWVPNPQPVQIPRTYSVPRTVCEQVPVTTTRMIQEQVVQKVPITITEMVREKVVKKVPYTTMKPVKELVENKVPVKVCRWTEEERVRQVPYTTWKTVCEQRQEQYEVKVCKMVAEEKICRVPRVVQKYIPIDAWGCEIAPASPSVGSSIPLPSGREAVDSASPSVLKEVESESILPAPLLESPEGNGGANRTFAEKHSIVEEETKPLPTPLEDGKVEAFSIPPTPVLPPAEIPPHQELR